MPRTLGMPALLVLLAGGAAGAGEYDFSIPEAEKKPCSLSGRLEMRAIDHRLDGDAARTHLSFFRDDPGNATQEYHPAAEFKAGYSGEKFQARLLTHHEFSSTEAGDEWINEIYEAYATLTPSPNFTLEAGKKVLLWGKGYAWNPAGFVNRPKDPDDPGLSQEGFSLVSLDLIKSLTGGALNNVGLTALILPVVGDWANPELGTPGDLNAAAKLYLLWYDTDLDFIVFGGPDQPASYGVDLARNLSDNLEVHGELAFRREMRRVTLDQSGRSRSDLEDQTSWLVGLRYLTELETTYILEYYRNGAGYGEEELEQFFRYQGEAWAQWLTTHNAAVMDQAVQRTAPYYMQRNFGTDYAYLKVSQKEPGDILYFTPWVAAVVNLHDWSLNLQPGVTYTPVTNWELNARIGIPLGPRGTEFGEKQDDLRTEVWIRYYF